MSIPIDTSKRIALITGCSEINSLGAAFSLELISRGWVVFATARKESTLSELKQAGCQTLALDVSSDDSVYNAARIVKNLTGGRLDLLINNAGASGSAALVQTDPAKFAIMHDLHVLGPLRLTQAFFPDLSSTASKSGRRTKIVNIGSVISHGMPWNAAYASTKAGVQILSDVMRREFAPYNIDVITVELALVRTAMTAGTKEFSLAHDDATIGEEYHSADAVKQAGIEFEKSSQSAPTAKEVAESIINAVELKKSPGKLYLGKNSFLFKNVIPYLPTSVADAMFSKIMRMDLVKP